MRREFSSCASTIRVYSIPKSVYTSHGICPDFKNVELSASCSPPARFPNLLVRAITRPSTVRGFPQPVTS